MIEINLLPPELRPKVFSGTELSFNISKKLILFVIAVLSLPNIVILLVILAKGLMLGRLEGEFKKIESHKARIDQLAGLEDKLKGLQDMFLTLVKERPAIACQLNTISNIMPEGIWLDGLHFKEGSWEIKGRCYSPASNEMARIGRFVNALKAGKKESREFASLELSSVQRKNLGPTEVAEFIISSKAKDTPKKDKKGKKDKKEPK